mgnify:FL=1
MVIIQLDDDGASRETWAMVRVAPNLAVAEMLQELLQSEGIIVMLRPASIPHLGAGGPVEVLVPEGQLIEARRVLGPGEELECEPDEPWRET